jgi:hypothetical protein
MIVGRVIGWVLMLVGLVILARDLLVLGAGYDLLTRFDSKPHGAPIVLGELWYAIHPDSLQLLQPAIQRHLHPALWDWVVQPALLSWAWVIFTALGFAFLVLFQRRRDRLRRRQR